MSKLTSTSNTKGTIGITDYPHLATLVGQTCSGIYLIVNAHEFIRVQCARGECLGNVSAGYKLQNFTPYYGSVTLTQE